MADDPTRRQHLGAPRFPNELFMVIFPLLCRRQTLPARLARQCAPALVEGGYPQRSICDVANLVRTLGDVDPFVGFHRTAFTVPARNAKSTNRVATSRTTLRPPGPAGMVPRLNRREVGIIAPEPK